MRMWHGSHLVLVACLSTESRCLTEHRLVRSLPGLVSMVAAALATAVQSPCNPNLMIRTPASSSTR